MEGLMKEKRKNKSIIRKTWERCKSFGNIQTQQKAPSSPSNLSPQPVSLPGRMVKSKSWSSFGPSSPLTPQRVKRVGSKKARVDPYVPNGHFSVYVGPDKQRFVIKVACTSHPLFKMLLEEAEVEYGYHSEGPLVLPCEVDVFVKVLFEMDVDDEYISDLRCGAFPKSRSSYHLLSLPRLVSLNQV